jgi:hypothetical protein
MKFLRLGVAPVFNDPPDGLNCKGLVLPVMLGLGTYTIVDVENVNTDGSTRAPTLPKNA